MVAVGVRQEIKCRDATSSDTLSRTLGSGRRRGGTPKVTLATGFVPLQEQRHSTARFLGEPLAGTLKAPNNADLRPLCRSGETRYAARR
jgi:hypothetical protein